MPSPGIVRYGMPSPSTSMYRPQSLSMRARVAWSSSLPRSERLVRILERVRHPGIHAEVEIAHHEHQRLEAFGQVERVHRHRVALLHRRRQQHDVLRVAVRQRRHLKDVSLRRARREPGGRPDALNVEDDPGQLGVVREPGKLPHQRDAGPGRGRHRRAPPPSRRR